MSDSSVDNQDASSESASEQVIDANTAFLVFQDMDGFWRLAPDLTMGIRVRRAPQLGDFASAAGALSKDAMVSEVVGHVLGLLKHAQQAAQQQIQTPTMSPAERAAVQALLNRR